MHNFDPAENIHVEANDDGVKVRFSGETLALNATSTGFSVTNDWNNRHFTLAFDESSLLYHLTHEDIVRRRDLRVHQVTRTASSCRSTWP